jgi:hypothetical protein
MRDWIRQKLPTEEALSKRPVLRWMGPLLAKPWLWHLNRRRVALGVGIGVFFGFLLPVAQIAPIVTPDTSLTGKVVKFNETARIVVLEFSILNMPAAGRQLFIYRNDLKVGEVKTTTWQKQEHIVADLINGEAREGDVVRDR